jgi:hypothetical protein
VDDETVDQVEELIDGYLNDLDELDEIDSRVLAENIVIWLGKGDR